MRIAYVMNGIQGHNILYAKTLVDNGANENILLVPAEITEIGCRQIVIGEIKSRYHLVSYVKMIKHVKKICEFEKVDIIHFLNGDVFYRFFGLGLREFRKYKVIMTFHWIKTGALGKVSTKIISRRCKNVIAHSAYLCKEIRKLGVNNCESIEYPCFNTAEISIDRARMLWNIDINKPILLCVGSTREAKGIDLLLEALNGINKPFQLLIAGKEGYFTSDYIEEHSQLFRDNVTTDLRILSDDEYNMAIEIADYILLPYKKKFNGASGPLVDGVYREKCIIGANHGNLGFTIENYHLGYTFESENIEELRKVIDKALDGGFVKDEKYINYRHSLDVGYFVERYMTVYMRED